MLMLIPDRLPSLLVLIGFWIPPTIAGGLAAWSLQRNVWRGRLIYLVLVTFIIGYAALWFLFNAGRMPPYIPGATDDPTGAPPQAIANLAIFTTILVLPGSALACLLALRSGRRLLG